MRKEERSVEEQDRSEEIRPDEEQDVEGHQAVGQSIGQAVGATDEESEDDVEAHQAIGQTINASDDDDDVEAHQAIG
jgi:hypothetical protein